MRSTGGIKTQSLPSRASTDSAVRTVPAISLMTCSLRPRFGASPAWKEASGILRAEGDGACAEGGKASGRGPRGIEGSAS